MNCWIRSKQKQIGCSRLVLPKRDIKKRKLANDENLKYQPLSFRRYNHVSASISESTRITSNCTDIESGVLNLRIINSKYACFYSRTVRKKLSSLPGPRDASIGLLRWLADKTELVSTLSVVLGRCYRYRHDVIAGDLTDIYDSFAGIGSSDVGGGALVLGFIRLFGVRDAEYAIIERILKHNEFTITYHNIKSLSRTTHIFR